jgi:hypothetical protein
MGICTQIMSITHLTDERDDDVIIMTAPVHKPHHDTHNEMRTFRIARQTILTCTRKPSYQSPLRIHLRMASSNSQIPVGKPSDPYKAKVVIAWTRLMEELGQ